MPRTNSLLATRHSLLATSVCLSLLLCLLMSLLPPFASAQVQTGTPPLGSFAGGPEVINLANLNAHLDIPVLHRAGRGTDFTYDITYDSSVWYPLTGSSTTWTPVLNWGWTGLTPTTTGYATYKTTNTTCQYFDSGLKRWITENYTKYSGWVYFDSFGISHTIGGGIVQDGGAPDCGPPFTAPLAHTLDGTGYTFAIDGGPDATVYTKYGATSALPLQTPGAGAPFTDRNGNQISLSGGVFKDTLATTALTVSGVAPSNTTFTYTAPSGANATYTVKYTNYSVQTNFSCPNITDYGTNGTTTANLVSEIDLPDGSKYSFFYEATPGHSGYVTARLASVILPTGGTISYTYSGGNNGINCSDGSTATLTRQTPDTGTSSSWTYAQTKGTGAASTTTVTDPLGNVTTIQFQGIYETQRTVYQGSTSGTVLQTANTCYNAATSPCTSTAITLPITQRTVMLQPGASAGTSEQLVKYSSYGLVTEEDDYDYATPGPGPLLRKTTVSYASLGTYLNAFKQTVDVYNGSGTLVSQTTNNYDETTPTPTSGITQHTSVSGSRGNLTSINYPVSGLTSHFTYYDTGVLNTSQDVNGATTTYNYNSTNNAYCNGAFPTSISEPLSLSRSMTWNCAGGVQLTATDENGKTSTSAFANDKYFWRPDSVTDQSGATINFCYAALSAGGCPSTPASNQVETYLNFNSGGSTADSLTTLDSLGRPSLQQTRQSPSSTNFDSVLQWYDTNGRIAHVTVPYIGTAGQNCCGAPASTNTYDALNRPLTLTDSGNGTLTYTYNLNDILIAAGPNPTGENTKKRQLEYDALGRLTSVCEVTAGTTAWPGASCNQNSAQTGYLTKYTYDALGNLTGVTQNAQSTTNQQTRSYSYDAMSRLTSETNPESGTKTYVYDTDSTMCGNGAYASYGDLLKTTDANGNCVMRYHDQLHRITDVGTNQAGSPCKRFRYDNTNGVLGSKPSGVSVSNTLARLAEAETDTCASPITQSTIITDEWFSYTARGETSDKYQSSPNSGGYYHANILYWPNGAVEQVSGLPTLPTFTYGVDGEGRMNTLSASTGQNPLTATTYNSASLPTALTLGSGDSDSFTYDPNTFRTTQYKFNVNTQSFVGTLGWNANGTLGSQNITDPFNAADTQNCSYSHDDLVRIASVNCGASTWQQNFSYDPFGNITKTVPTGGTGNSLQPTYSAATNRMTSLPGFTPTYDADGNVLTNSAHTYTWNAYGNYSTADGTTSYTFDALGRLVELVFSPSSYQLFYLPNGSQVGFQGQVARRGEFNLPGGVRVNYDSTNGGLINYEHPDHLGSLRLITTPTRTYSDSLAYAPFGETYAVSSATPDQAFTGMNSHGGGLDTFTFPERVYSNQGRWISPDPAGLAAVNPTNPQSWNRYAYVLNNPLRFIDPIGLACVDAKGYIIQDENGDEEYPDEQSCEDGGGTWIDPVATTVVVNGNDDGSGDDGSGLPPAGCAFFYQDGGLDGTQCGDQFIPPSIPRPTNDQYITAIARSLPTVCGGGVFYYAGHEASVGPVDGFAGYITEYDSNNGVSGGAIFEAGGGEGIVGGAGHIVAGNSQEGLGSATFLYGGAGFDAIVAGGSVGEVGYTSGAGLYAEGQILGKKRGVGAYLNITTTAGCNHK